MNTFGNFNFTTVQMFPFTGLFHRSISQSGTATCSWALTPKGRPKALAEQVAGLFDCPANTSKDLISCLRKQDAYKLYSADREIKVSCQKRVENVLKLNSDKANNDHVEHSRPGSTIDLHTHTRNKVPERIWSMTRKLIASKKQSGFP